MGRRTDLITIDKADSRDFGKSFGITEMPAEQAADWFFRAMQHVARSGVDVPPNIFAAGPLGFVTMGIGTALTSLSKAPWEDVKPLLQELKACVTSFVPPNGTVPVTQNQVIWTQVEEPETVFKLYHDILSLHLGFSIAARLSYYREFVASMIATIGQNTSTSTEESGRSSPPGSLN